MLNLLPPCMAFIQLRTFTVKVCENCPLSLSAPSDKQWDTSLCYVSVQLLQLRDRVASLPLVSMSLQLYSCTNLTPSHYTGAHPLTCSPALVCPVCAEAPRSLHCSSSPPPPIDGQIPFSYDGCPWQQSV